jgi:hypothetical protein
MNHTKQEDPYRSLWMLGLTMTLPMILLAGPLGGFLIGQMVMVKQFGMPAFWTPLLMMIGLAGSGLETYRLIKKLKENRRNS